MLRSPWLRALTLALVLPLPTVRPALAVAHGVEHGRVSDHVAEHAGEAAHRVWSDEEPVATLESGDPLHVHRHAHPVLDATCGARLIDLAPAEPPTTWPHVLRLDLGASAAHPAVPKVRAHGAHAPPPSLRAPPAPAG